VHDDNWKRLPRPKHKKNTAVKMGEDDDSFATNFTFPLEALEAGGDDTHEDAFLKLFVQQFLSLLWDHYDPKQVLCILNILKSMNLHLPENAEARESISRTNIIQCLVLTIYIAANNQLSNIEIFDGAADVLESLISGNHIRNIKACHQYHAIPTLLYGMTRYLDKHNVSARYEHLLALLIAEDLPLHENECLLDYSCIPAIVCAMMNRSDLQEWGCSKLKYILQGWDQWTPSAVTKPLNPEVEKMSDDAGQHFLESGAIDAILNALATPSPAVATSFSPTPETIREASKCVLFLAQKSPNICSTLIEKGAVTLLATALQKFPGDAINAELLLTIALAGTMLS
jgi:hypothetical protein